VDEGVIAAGRALGGWRRRWTNQFRDAFDSQDVGETQHLLDAVQFVVSRDASVQRNALEFARKPWVVAGCNSCTKPAGGKCKDGGAIAALGRDGDVIPAPEASQEPRARRCCWPLRHGDNAIDVRITRDNSRRIGKRQHVDCRTGPCAAQAPNQWRG
jgi:hypothetical protein